MTDVEASTGPRRTSGDGWGWFAVSLVARIYLTVFATLVIISMAPLLFGMQPYLVRGGSMEPHINAGDVVMASPFDDERSPIGLVVVFPMGGNEDAVTIHRVVDVDVEGRYVTAGDANAQVDAAPLPSEDITALGRILVPFVGLPVLWLTTGAVLPFVIWAVLTAFAVFAVAVARSSRDDESSDEHPVEEGGVTRRATLSIAVVGAGMLVATVLPPPKAHAAFTARAVNTHNTWSVRTLPALTLGRLTPYALFAGTSVANVAFLGIGTSVSGSVGTSPGIVVVGFWPWDISGSIDRNTAGARNARTDAEALITAIRARPVTAQMPATLSGTLHPGVQESTGGTTTISGTLTLDARGDSSAVFIFRGSTLRAAANSRVVLAGGASADRVFWHFTSGITLDQESQSVGNYVTGGSAAMERNSTLSGRLAALGGAITVTRATVSLP